MGMLSEFREFAVKGNAVDMAVGIIIGGAFGKIVTSLVNDIIMPPIGMLLASMPFSTLAIPFEQEHFHQVRFISQHGARLRHRGILHVPGGETNEPGQERDAAIGRTDHKDVPSVSFDDPVEGETMCPLHVAA